MSQSVAGGVSDLDQLTERLDEGDSRSEHDHRERNQEDILTSQERGVSPGPFTPKLKGKETHLDHSSQSQDQTTSRSDQEHRSDVERESDRSVRQECEESDLVQVLQGLKSLGEDEAEPDHGGADGGVEVDGYQGVHLHSLEDDLDQDQTSGFDLVKGDLLANSSHRQEMGGRDLQQWRSTGR